MSGLIYMEEEFEEEEVWAMERGKKNESPKVRKHKNASFSSQSGSNKIPRSKSVGEQSRQSVPVNIPNWSKICNRNGEEEEEDEEEDKLPPHEWLARKMARSQISSSSVCEGAGRTLKGRDQRRVRDAVLTRTGFLE
ncbi:uncharacterized protein LOC110033789 [Phalaenopsis equestris]|uniref:uncharacterized protein LOC110033789 n=1 Tax=Phalaenopsis equestris TaxID=78828 RepID=UPI0009E2DE2D|nr:uncharacterized protein LOC110033789 [Phalaenopsis equestris]